MTREIRWTLSRADDATFTGAAHSALLAGSADGAALRLYYVRFEPGARTHWHAHSGVQTLLVREGSCRYQEEGGPLRVLQAGEVVEVPAGVLHWHGAAPDAPMAHVAINRDNPATDWGREVTEEEYGG